MGEDFVVVPDVREDCDRCGKCSSPALGGCTPRVKGWMKGTLEIFFSVLHGVMAMMIGSLVAGCGGGIFSTSKNEP